MSAPSPTGSNGRSTDGTFLPGNKWARGNPHQRRIQALRSAMLEAVTPERLAGIVKKMTILALKGDVQAAKLVLEHTVGKPAASIALTGPDGEALGADYARMETAILAAVEPLGTDLRFRIALALKGVVDAGRAQQADGPD